jgi:glycosyltransferase involved in cell wall biosynthesis
LKIAINTRLLIKGKLEGIGWFTFENLKRITISHPEHQFYFFFDRPYNKDFIFAENIIPVVLHPQARHPFLYYIWFQYSLKNALKKINPDVFISTDGYLPLNTSFKTLNVFHDLNFEHYPSDLPILERWYYRHFFPKFAHEATRIATVSEYSKKDIAQLYEIDTNNIDVVYNGANEIYAPVSEEIKTKTLQKLTGGLPYFFFIGSLHPRKNLVNLFKAYDLFRKTDKNNVKLVITGARKWWTKDIELVFNGMSFKNDVIFTGRLDIEEIKKILGSAEALTYVSYFEGFGIPIVEAFRCGTPVITSNRTSMPEVAGNAAIIVDPFNSNEIADAMHLIMEDKTLRDNLITKGYERAQEFTWDKAAKRLWQSIEKTININ